MNAAGIAAPDIAASLEGLNPAHVPRAHYAKGNYFALVGVRSPFRHLVYPMPEAAGLGIHATLDLAGQVRFGPDVEWIERPDYGVDPAREASFAASIRRYWPSLPDGALVPSYAGIRPKITGPGEPAADFVVQGRSSTGSPGSGICSGLNLPA